MGDASTDAALVGYADGLLQDQKVVKIGRVGSDLLYAIDEIYVQSDPSDPPLVVAKLTNGKELFLATGQLGYVLAEEG